MVIVYNDYDSILVYNDYNSISL